MIRYFLVVFLSIVQHQALIIHSKATAATLIASILLDSNPPLESSFLEPLTDRQYILQAKIQINQIDQRITLDSDIEPLLRDINFIVNTFQLQSRINIVVAQSPTPSIQLCTKSAATKLRDYLSTISEYYSISNDTRKKLLISDAYPGQKAEFLKMGLKAISSELQNLLFCGS